MRVLPSDIITIAKIIWNGLTGVISWGFSYAQTEVIVLGYRKVGYLEQAWYIIKYKIRQIFHRR